MDCYIEILAGLIRYGPHAHIFPNPYIGTITFSGDKQVATLKGLVVPKTIIVTDGVVTEKNRFTFAESREILKTVEEECRALGLAPVYERIKELPLGLAAEEKFVVLQPEVLKALPQLRRK